MGKYTLFSHFLTLNRKKRELHWKLFQFGLFPFFVQARRDFRLVSAAFSGTSHAEILKSHHETH